MRWYVRIDGVPDFIDYMTTFSAPLNHPGSRVDCLSFGLRGYHNLTAIRWVCCGVSIFCVGGLGRGSGLVLTHLTTAVLRLRFHRF